MFVEVREVRLVCLNGELLVRRDERSRRSSGNGADDVIEAVKAMVNEVIQTGGQW